MAAAMVVAIVANAVEFRRVDQGTVEWFRAIYRYPTADLHEITYTSSCDSCRQRYGLHLALRAIAPGSRVLVDRSGPYGESRYLTEEFELRLSSFGGVGSIEWVDAAAVTALLPPNDPGPAGLDPTPYIVASGPGGDFAAPWALAVGPDAGVDRDGDPDEFVADALRAGEHRERSASPREFIVLRWEVPRGQRHDYQDLVLDTSLLPASLRAELR